MMLFWCKLMQLYSMALWYFVIPWYFAPKGGTMRRLLVSFLSGIHWFQCLLHLPSVSLSSIFSSYHSSGRSGCLCYCQPLTDNLRVLWISYIYFLNWPTIQYYTTTVYPFTTRVARWIFDRRFRSFPAFLNVLLVSESVKDALDIWCSLYYGPAVLQLTCCLHYSLCQAD